MSKKILLFLLAPALLAAPASARTAPDEDEMFREVVATGYQFQRKADLTGAVSVVNIDDIAGQNENNPIKALQGRIPGMNIYADGSPSGISTVRIRSFGSAFGNDPLYVIDGVPSTGGLHELNGSDIESIQILKDAAAAAIFGGRAANGVIIITTRKGREGKVRVDFDASVSISYYTNKMKVLNAREWGQALWQANVNDGCDPNANNLGYHFDWGYNAMGIPELHDITMNEFLDEAGTVPTGDTDWFDESTRRGIVQKYNVSVSHGSKRGSSFVSLGYYRNDGIIKSTDFDRFSARFNGDYKVIKDIVTIGENFTVNRTSEVQAPEGFLENVFQFNPNYPVYTAEGEYANLTGSYADRENPISILSHNSDNRYVCWRMFGDVHLNIAPFKGFNVRSTFGIDYSQRQQRIFTYPVLNGNASNPANAVEAAQAHRMKWMWNAVASYNFEVGRHRGDILAGVELNRQNDNWFSGKRYDYAVLNPDYMWPSAGTGAAEAYGGAGGSSLLSFFAKAGYSYGNRYMVSATLRYDGSSRFSANNRFGFFPSVSAGWRISEESFIKDNAGGWLDNLNIRASWGVVGNQEIPNTAHYTLYTSGGYGVYGSGSPVPDSGFRRYQIGNENLKWETTTQINVGLDFGFFRDALYGSFDWYDKRTEDILVLVPGIAVIGEGSSMWTNAGRMLDRGCEFVLGWRGTKGGFHWDLSGNIAAGTNRITGLPDEIASTGVFGGNGVESIVGHAIGSQAGYVFDGIFKSQEEVDNYSHQEGAGVGRMRFKDLNGDGKINEEDQTWIYNPTPAFTYGINICLQYKSFDISMFWQGVKGVDVIAYDYKTQTDLWSGVNAPNLNKGARLLNAWSPSNSDSTIPALSLSDNNNEKRFSSYYVEDGSFLKLRTIQLGYSLPEAWARKICMQRLRLYVSAQNLLTIKSRDFTGVDPEVPAFGYPVPVNVTFGLNVSF